MAAPHGTTSPPTAPEEDPLRSPGWLPWVGLALLLLGALWVYLWITPGMLNPPADGGDAALDAASAEAGAPQVPH